MKDENVCIACHCDGELNTNERNKPLYMGGTVKGLMIRGLCTFDELDAEIYSVGKIRKKQYETSIICN